LAGGSAPGASAKDRTCASNSDNQRSFCSWLASNHRVFISLDRCAILCRFQLGGLRQTDRSFRSSLFGLLSITLNFPTLDLAPGFERLGLKRNPGFRIQLLLGLINDPAISSGLLSRAPPLRCATTRGSRLLPGSRIWAENRTRSRTRSSTSDKTRSNTGSGVAVLLEGEANPKYTNALRLGFRA
jgi:hypothetical protein